MISLVYWNIHKSKNIEKSDPLLYKLNLQRLLTLYRNKNVCRLTGIMKKALLCMTARVLYIWHLVQNWVLADSTKYVQKHKFKLFYKS